MKKRGFGWLPLCGFWGLLAAPAILGAATLDLYRPYGLAVTADGTRYTANPFRSEIDKFSASGEHLLTFGSFGTGDGAFRGCSGVALDSQGRVYVADTGNSRLVRLLDGDSALVWDGVVVGPAGLNFPRDLCIDAQDRIFVVDESDTVKAFDTQGTPLGIFAGGASWFGGTGSAPGKLRSPHGIAVLADGSFLVADTLNDRVQKFDSLGAFLWARGAAGTGPEQFLQPRDVAVNSEGRIYVADAHNHRIQELDPQGTYLSDSGSGAWEVGGVPNADTLAMGPGDQLHLTVAGGEGTAQANTDHTPPEILIEGVAAAMAYGHPVVPLVTVTDLNPRLAAVTLNGEPFASGTEVAAGGLHTLSVYAEDAWGNTATASVRFTLDYTGPEIRFTGAADGQSYSRDVTVTYAVRDNFDPSPVVSASHPSGTTFTTSGAYTVTVGAVDWVGNRSERAVSFRIFKLPDLIGAVSASGLPAGMTNSLLSKLNNALALLEAGQANAAVNLLGAFTHAVEAQRGKQIPTGVADEWIGFAEELIRLVEARWLERTLGEVLIKPGSAGVTATTAAEMDGFLAELGNRGISRIVLDLYAPTGSGTGSVYLSGGLPGAGVTADPAWSVDLGPLLERAHHVGMDVLARVQAFRSAGGVALSPADAAHRAHLSAVMTQLLATYPALDGIVAGEFAYAAPEPADSAVLAAAARELAGSVRARGKPFYLEVAAAADAAEAAVVLAALGQDYGVLAGACDGFHALTAHNVDADRNGWADHETAWVGRVAAFLAGRVRAAGSNAVVVPRIQTHDLPEPFEDGNGNGRYDAGEPFTDLSADGLWGGYLLTGAAEIADAISGLAVEDVAAVCIDHLQTTSATEWDAVLNSHPR